MKKLLFISILLFKCNLLFCQLTVLNPGLEGTPGQGITPGPWQNCMPFGFYVDPYGEYATPDTHPNNPPIYEIILPPSEGESYIGFGEITPYFGISGITSFQEGFSQELSSPMEANNCPYVFNIDLANGLTPDPWNLTGIETTIAEVKVYGGFDVCSEEELLWESGPITNENWETYTVEFIPSNNYTHILFEAFKADPKSECGYVLADNITPIINIPPLSEAGENQELCANTTTLNANSLQENEEGTWIVIFGNGDFEEPNNPNTEVNNLNIGENIFEWVVTAECVEESSSDQVTITLVNEPIVEAGEDQELCENFTTLNANSPQEDEIGTWIVISGNAVFNNINDPNAIVSGLNIGENIFQWTISSLLCGEYTDQVSMIYIDNIPYSNAGENQELCEDFTTLNANSIQNTETGIWTIISGNGNFITPNNPNTQVTNLSLGENIFEWTVEDACNSVSSQVAITFQNTTNTIQSISNYNGFNISCPQTSDGFIEITTTGGYPPYSFNWSGPNSFSSSTQNIYNLEAGMYDCVVTDQLNCESTISIQLTPPYPLEIDFIGVEDMNCFDNPYIDFDITGGTGELEGVINTSWGEVITFIADNSNEWYFQYDNFTQWDGEINISIIDSNGCTLNSDDITVQTWDDPVGNFDVSTNNTSISELIDFFDLSNSEAEIINWTWDFGDGTISNLQNPTHFYQGNDQYTVCLTIEDANGCISEKCSIINIFNNTHAYIPNIFTINDDELNEVFEPIIYGLDTDTYNLLIYDRWGKLLFSTTDHQKGWDGKYNGQIVTQDIYSYKIKYNTISGEEKTHTGKITLMK
ncbi:MAG: hypothetical protein CMD27_02420 [Flavobacteriales bacterium]|nr:hypothetical protein [Flavobacteriales bacterium]